jgi:hypothetical protein
MLVVLPRSNAFVVMETVYVMMRSYQIMAEKGMDGILELAQVHLLIRQWEFSGVHRNGLLARVSWKLKYVLCSS